MLLKSSAWSCVCIPAVRKDNKVQNVFKRLANISMSTANSSLEGLTLLHEFIYIMSCEITEQLLRGKKEKNTSTILAEGLAEDYLSDTCSK